MSPTGVLGFDSYRIDTAVHRFESPPLARAAYEEAMANAKKSRSKKAKHVDGTRPFEGQADWDGDRITRVWLTAIETPDTNVKNRNADEQLAAVLAKHPKIEEVSIGLQQWNNSHQATFDPVLAVLEAKRPPLTALAFGDYDNTGGHIIKLADPARIAALYPSLQRLRLTATRIDGGALDRPWPALTSLTLCTKHRDGDWEWLLDGARTPALRELRADDETLRASLAKSPLVKKRGVTVTVVDPISRYRSSWE